MCMLLVGIFSLAGALAISFALRLEAGPCRSACHRAPWSPGWLLPRQVRMQFNAMNDAVFQESSKFGAESIGAFEPCPLVMERAYAEVRTTCWTTASTRRTRKA